MEGYDEMVKFENSFKLVEFRKERSERRVAAADKICGGNKMC